MEIRRALVPHLQRSHRVYFVVYQEGNVVRMAWLECSWVTDRQESPKMEADKATNTAEVEKKL